MHQTASEKNPKWEKPQEFNKKKSVGDVSGVGEICIFSRFASRGVSKFQSFSEVSPTTPYELQAVRYSLMADQILSSFLGKLVDYAAVPVGRQFSYLFCYDGNLKEFRSQLAGLEMERKGVKLKVEAAERNGEVILPNVEGWLKKVGEASDDSNRFIREEEDIGKCCFNGPLNPKVRYQRSRKAKKKATEFDAIKKECNFDLVAVPAPPLPIGYLNNENKFDFESRRSIFNQIMEAVRDDGVGMIGIWGMAGIGKTTLVKKVAKCAQDEGLFEGVAMAVVSQNPSVRAIQGQIADAIGLTFKRESEEGRASQLLQRLLALKKILVILDDIWGHIEPNDIGIPSGNQHKGCKIILTSRNLGVCKGMGTQKNFPIETLSEDEALYLFLKVLGDLDRSSEKWPLAEKLSKECGCLPICLVILAGGLRNIDEIFVWKDMLNRLGKSQHDEKVHASIELSYENLYGEEEKKFFLLCALFPEDYEIPVEVLFEYGLGLNLFERVDNLDEAFVRAQNLASKLKSQCLFLDEGNEKFVKMHDVVRDVALVIISKRKHAFFLPTTSLWFDDPKKLPDVLECPQLQILTLNFSYPSEDFQLHDNFFARMKNLIVLDMSFYRLVRLPQSFAALENLRTLCFDISSLPDISAIGKLHNLVSLSFTDGDIEVLPKEVGELSNLRLLDLSGCENLKEIAPGVIQKLSQLEVLLLRCNILWCDGKEVGCPENASLSELIHLSRLTILEIVILDASMLPDDVLFENLKKFKVSIGQDHLTWTNIFLLNSNMLKLDGLSKNMLLKAGIKMLMKKAHYLELKNISGITVALPHLGGYGSLKELIVNNCKDVNYILDMTESEYEPETPSLQRLHLINLPLFKGICKGKFRNMFVSNLEHLELEKLPSLIRLWPFQAEYVALTNLSTMSVKSCDKLDYVFEHNSARSLYKLKKLEVKKCRNLKAICLSEEQGDNIVFPQLRHLQLSELENLTSFDSKCTDESTLFSKQVIFLALEKLNVSNLGKMLKKIWQVHTPIESFFQLKLLSLEKCAELLVVFPPQATSSLQNLEEICIANCHKLITLWQLDDLGDEMLLFPRLSKLVLVNLPKFTTILSTTSKNISQATVSFGKLRHLKLEQLKSMEEMWPLAHPTPNVGELTYLGINNCDRMVKIFPSNLLRGLQNLETLWVESCRSLEHVFEAEDHPPLFSSLGVVYLADLPELKQLWWNRNSCESFGLPRLRCLNIKTCPTLEFIFDPSVANRLENLKTLDIKNCSSMVEIVAEKTGKKIEFPLAKSLTLKDLPRLKVKQFVEFPKVELMILDRCFNMDNFLKISVLWSQLEEMAMSSSNIAVYGINDLMI